MQDKLGHVLWHVMLCKEQRKKGEREGGEEGRGGRDVEEDEDEGTEDQREIEGVLVQESLTVL